MSVLRHRLQAYVRPSGFDPDSISGLFAWFDADDASTFTYSSGVIVSQWNDKSGNGYHISQGTVANQPTRDGTQNGRTTVQFLDATHWMTNTTGLTPATISAFVVLRRRGVTVANVYWFTSTEGRFGFECNTATKIERVNQAALMTANTSIETTQYHLITAYASASATSVRLDGVDDGSGSGSGMTASNAGFGVGGKTNGDFPADAMIAELLVYDSNLSTTDRDSVEEYLQSKWGTP